jgi:hypothetical protein
MRGGSNFFPQSGAPMRSLRWGVFSIIEGPCRRYVVAQTRMSGHRRPGGAMVTVTESTGTVTVTMARIMSQALHAFASNVTGRIDGNQ